MKTITEPAREIPVAHACDLCVVGGSCTGVFAAVSAARLGLSVALVEATTVFGGMATAARVNEWHSLDSVDRSQRIIGGLTSEVLDRLHTRHAVNEVDSGPRGIFSIFNSAEMAIELDRLVTAHSIRPFLQCACVGAIRDGNRVEAAIIEDKSGRRAIRARYFIDASGDGDLLRRAGFAAWRNPQLQPVTYQVLAAGFAPLFQEEDGNLWPRIKDSAGRFGYPEHNARPWIKPFPGPADLHNIFGPRLNNIDASDADQLTQALLDSRRHHRALMDMLTANFKDRPAPVALPHALGVRETWHAHCRQRLSADELMAGKAFDDRIACGTYPVDVHSPEGTILRYLDGREQVIFATGGSTWRQWRDSGTASPACYFIPFGSLVPKQAENLLVAGRLIDADREAFGGVRVMVNMNQTGEAAGTAIALASREDARPGDVDPATIRETMQAHGSPINEAPLSK